MKKRSLLLALAILAFIDINAQSTNDEVAIKQVIQQLFDGMRQGDSLMIKDLFVPGCAMASIFTNKQGEVIKRPGSSDRFVTAVGTPHAEVWDEQIWSYDIKTDGPMGYAWTEYTFYLGDKLSHCGVNVFEMIHLKDGWKISDITDTRRTTDCKSKSESDVHDLMNAWHKAAATADEDIFFRSMTADGIYIGTDAGERWSRDEMKAWSKKHFEKESAWTFKVASRNVTFSEDESIGWFDELLDTWMGPCRGSGVVIKTIDGWKIKHYHLAIAVPNEKVNGYLDLIGQPRKQ